MNRLTLALSALTVGSSAACVWLWMENRHLRAELDTANIPTASAVPGRRPSPVTPAGKPGTPAVRTVTASPATGRERPGGKPAALASAAALNIRESGDGSFLVSDAAGTWEREMTTDELQNFRRTMDAALTSAATRRPGGPYWSPGTAAGAPNTAQHGDFPTAWASQMPDAGLEWLQLKYNKSVEVREINIHESFNPGALAKVSAIMPDGSQRVIWEGTEAPEEGLVERALKVPPGIRSDQIRIELDTSLVPGWNEIDAVEIVGADGSRQWAAEATASSHFGQGGSAMGLTFSGGDEIYWSGTGRLMSR